MSDVNNAPGIAPASLPETTDVLRERFKTVMLQGSMLVERG